MLALVVVGACARREPARPSAAPPTATATTARAATPEAAACLAGRRDTLPVARPGWTLVWRDEFDADGLPDSTRWTYDVGGHGWGNAELQTYTARDTTTAHVRCGALVITAWRPDTGSFRSARLKTMGRAAWRYGRIEARAVLPGGRGTWPAIWMLPETSDYGGWPKSGEIDVMEHVGFDPDVVHGTVHTEAFNHTRGTQRGHALRVPGAREGWHVYAVEWSPERIDFLIDEVRHFSFANSGRGPAEWPFDRPFHLLVNLAVGGGWGGQQGVDSTSFPHRLRVDHVRVYRRP